MPFALTFAGLLLIILGFQNTYKEFGQQVQSDFSGEGNFLYWMISLMVVGSLGYIKGWETFSRLFMGLIIVAIVLSEKSGTAQGINFFSNLLSGIASGTSTRVNSIGEGLPAGGSGGGGGSGGFDLSNVAETAKIATTVASFL